MGWPAVRAAPHRPILVRERDLFVHWVSRWQVGNTSNAYALRDPNSPLERALARFGAAVAAKIGIEQGDGGQERGSHDQ